MDHNTYCYNSQYVHDENFDEMENQSYSESQNDDFDEIQINEKDGDALLISLVREHPYLYNKELTDFKDIVKKQNAWVEIANVLDVTADECQVRWTQLRERYSREKKLKLQETTTGSGASKRKSFEFFEDMNFLEPFVKKRRTLTNVSIKNASLMKKCSNLQKNFGSRNENQNNVSAIIASTLNRQSARDRNVDSEQNLFNISSNSGKQNNVSSLSTSTLNRQSSRDSNINFEQDPFNISSNSGKQINVSSPSTSTLNRQSSRDSNINFEQDPFNISSNSGKQFNVSSPSTSTLNRQSSRDSNINFEQDPFNISSNSGKQINVSSPSTSTLNRQSSRDSNINFEQDPFNISSNSGKQINVLSSAINQKNLDSRGGKQINVSPITAPILIRQFPRSSNVELEQNLNTSSNSRKQIDVPMAIDIEESLTDDMDSHLKNVMTVDIHSNTSNMSSTSTLSASDCIKKKNLGQRIKSRGKSQPDVIESAICKVTSLLENKYLSTTLLPSSSTTADTENAAFCQLILALLNKMSQDNTSEKKMEILRILYDV